MNHPNLTDLRLLTALSARYSVEDLLCAYGQQSPLCVNYWPEGKQGPRRRWVGVPTADQITQIRLLIGAAIGRNPAEQRRVTGTDYAEPADSRSDIGTILYDYEKIRTYKWTTDHITKKPIPPNSAVWRDLHTGWITISCPMINKAEELIA